MKEQGMNKVTYFTKLRGTTFEGRQDTIARMQTGMAVRLRREPENQYDPRATAIDVQYSSDSDWMPIGYIAKDKNKDLAAELDKGTDVKIELSSITGGGDKSYGVNVKISYEREPAPEKKPVLNYVIDESLHKTKMFTSRLLGKTIKVAEDNGHIYLPGFLSGSKFPDKFYEEFDEERALGFILKKHYADAGADKTERIKASLKDMWSLKGDMSTGLGNAVHYAMEAYHKYKILGDKTKSVKTFKTKPDEVGPNKVLSKNPFIAKIVTDWADKFDDGSVFIPEEFVWDMDEMLAGSIDLIKVIDADKKIVRIQDYKTDADAHEKKYQLSTSPFKDEMGNELLDLHWLQLSFYAYILKKHGYTVEGLDIYWLNPNKLVTGENAWEKFSSKVINIEKGL